MGKQKKKKEAEMLVKRTPDGTPKPTEQKLGTHLGCGGMLFKRDKGIQCETCGQVFWG